MKEQSRSMDKLKTELKKLKKSIPDLKQAQKLQAALYQIADVTASSTDMNELYQSLHSIVGELMYARNFYIVLYDANDPNIITFPYFFDVEEEEGFWQAPMKKERFMKTLTGYMVGQGKAILATGEEIQSLQEKGLFQVLGKMMIEWLGVPLILSNSVIGAVVVQSYDPKRRYNEKDKELLTFVSQHIATALTRKRAEQKIKKAYFALEKMVENRTSELRKTNKDLELQIIEREKAERLQTTLFKITDLSQRRIKSEEFFSALHQIVSKLMYAENFYICLINNKTNMLDFPYYVNDFDQDDFGPIMLKEIYNEKKISLSEYVIKTRMPLLFTKNNKLPDNVIVLGHMPISWLGVPLKINNKAIGMLAVQSYTKDIGYGIKDKELLTFVSQHISTALQRKQDAEMLKIAHSELQNINDQLEHRVSDRTQELSKTNKELQKILKERKAIEKILAHHAYHDSLTGLPNRKLLLDRLEGLINKNNKNNNKLTFALLFLDIDRFKMINDSLGHIAGDKLLKEVSARLKMCIRSCDTVSRLSGDEFCILMDGIKHVEEVTFIADRMLEKFSEFFTLGEQRVFVTASIGITLSSIGYTIPSDVLRDADSAMYQAKLNGKAQYALFDKAMYHCASKRLRLENQLRFSVKNNEIYVDYQPIVELKSGEVLGFEALARWNTEEFGEVSPIEFIPIAEEIGLIFDLGNIVIQKAIEQIHYWRSLNSHCSDLSISVNLSPKQINEVSLFDNIMGVLSSVNLPAAALKLEITESLLIKNFDKAKLLMDKLTEQKIEFMLDDFGTEYSSLNYLLNLPISVIKIDRLFIKELGKRKENSTIISTIMSLAKNLNMDVISEGIETKAQAKILENLGMHYGQGYLYAKPMNAASTEKFLNQYCKHRL